MDEINSGIPSSDAEAKRISKFNDSLNQNMRLHNLWDVCNNLSSSGKLAEWNWKLDVIWRELSRDAEENDFQIMLKINKRIGETNKEKMKAAFYQLLNDKEIFLRKLQNKQGKGSSFKDAEEDEL